MTSSCSVFASCRNPVRSATLRMGSSGGGLRMLPPDGPGRPARRSQVKKRNPRMSRAVTSRIARRAASAGASTAMRCISRNCHAGANLSSRLTSFYSPEKSVPRHLIIAALICAVAAPSLAAQGQFGQGLAVAGREVYVGQPGNAYGPGVVYVFQPGTNGAWRAVKKLTMPGATNGDGFGSAIAIDGNTLLVGSTKADSGRGAVYLFTRDGTG